VQRPVSSKQKNEAKSPEKKTSSILSADLLSVGYKENKGRAKSELRPRLAASSSK
jgi:hypothetical protein